MLCTEALDSTGGMEGVTTGGGLERWPFDLGFEGCRSVLWGEGREGEASMNR